MSQAIVVAFCDYYNVMYEVHISFEDLSGLSENDLALSLHGRDGPRSLFGGRVIALKDIFDDKSPQGLLEDLTRELPGEMLANDEGAHFVRYLNRDIERAEHIIENENFDRIN